MAELTEKQNEIKQLVEHAVSQALQSELPQLQSRIAQQVLEALPAPASDAPASPEGSASTAADSSALVRAVATIHAGSTQKRNIARSAGCGQRLLKAHRPLRRKSRSKRSGWQARGFGDDDSIKDFPSI